MAEQTHSIDALPEPVFTETLPEGVLFVSPDGVLYQVVLAEGAGFRKAEQWPWSTSRVASEHRQPVALVPGSFLARNYPVVEKGRRLPTLTRSAFIDTEGQPAHFAFPDEQLAKFAAQLDATLTPQSGLTAYPENQRWLLGDGQHIFRVYHYAVSLTGLTIDLAERYAREHLKVRDCRFGPSYWQYLPGWKKPAPPVTDTERVAAALSASPAPSPLRITPSEETSAKPMELVTPPVSISPAIRTEAASALPIVPTGPEADQSVPVTPTAPPVVSAAPPDRSAERHFDFRSLFGRRTREQPETPNHQPPATETPPPVAAAASPAMTMPEPLPEPVTYLPEPPAPAPTEAIPSVSADEPALSPALQTEPNPAAPIPEDESDAMAASKSRKSRRTLMMVLSVDIGYGYTKGVGADSVRFSFPSVIGTAEDIRFAANLINGSTDRAVKFNEAEFFYGDQAVLQSRMQSTIFDRSRVHDSLYKMLFVSALVEMHKQAPDIERVRLVTGLPVEFFNDRADVVSLFEGTYQITTDQTFRITVESVFVAPQPFGSLFRELLNDQGRITNTDVEKGRVGVIDIGTYTTDFIVADELRYVQRLSGSARIGWSKVINKVEQALGDAYGLELTPHQVDRALNAGEVRVRGTAMPLKAMMDPAVDEVRAAIIARARDMWGEGVSLDTILVTGGGAAHLYELIREVYPHARLLDDAFWANAEGLYRFGRRPATFKE
jgi:plasmid segregation protein ParM